MVKPAGRRHGVRSGVRAIGHEGHRRVGVRGRGGNCGDSRRLHVLFDLGVLRTNDKIDIKDPGRCGRTYRGVAQPV